MPRPKGRYSGYVRSGKATKLGVSPADPEPKKPGSKPKKATLPPPEVIAEALANVDPDRDRDVRWRRRDRSKPAGKWSGAPE